MDREFLDLYNRELLLLHEHAREFAEEYPGIADRLGGLLDERMDPMIEGLLQGAAFLAARVQLKLKHEFPEFTSNLLEQLIPNYLAPTPSAALLKVLPPYSDPKLRDGYRVTRNSYLDATYRERDRHVACRYRLCADVMLWPFDITGAEYYPSAAPLQALGLPVGAEVLSGLRLSLTYRMAARIEEEISERESRKKPETWFSGCRVPELPVYILGAESDAITLYEQIISGCIEVFFRYLDDFGDPVVIAAPKNRLLQVGFDAEDSLFPNDSRLFRGFDYLREYFMFPRKFLGFKIVGLAEVMANLHSKSVDVLFAFNSVTARLTAAVQPSMLSLYSAPAINLFEKTTDRITIKSNTYEYQVVPDRGKYLEFEPHRILDVYAHYAGGQTKVPVRPLYSASMDRTSGTSEQNMFFTIRRLPRRRTMEEERYGPVSDYTGTDMFLSFIDESGVDAAGGVTELSVRALCSNRHLTEHLPVGEGGADFHLLDDVTLEIICVAGPTPPKAPVVSPLRTKSETANLGTVTWRLVNILSMNHLGLVEQGSGKNAVALREVLSMFADLADSETERKIRGVRNVASRPIVRRIRERTGIGAGRGLEITLSLDDKAFEGSGAFLLGAILERFFAEYSALNHFTQTVIRTSERGEIMRWPPRMGVRRPL
jgi:type VI secretion system protein ImpG